MRQRKFFTAVLMSIFINGCPDALTDSQSHAATAEESTPQQVAEPSAESGRVGSGAALRVNFTEAAKSADARTRAPSNPDVGDRGDLLELPSVPTSGSRKQASTPGFATPQTSRIRPCDVAAIPCPFDGVAQNNCASCTNPPPDPNAAVGAGRIVEVVNNLIQITDRLGAVQCGGAVTLNSFLSTTDGLTDPRVQFDNVNQRFSLTVTVSSVTASSTPAMWLATSLSEDPCGSWFLYRMTFNGDFYPRGTMLDFPMLGQDTHALLISIRTCLRNRNCLDADGAIFTVFGLPKSIVYSGAGMDGKAFRVDSLTGPVTNAGQPMIESPVSFFLAAVPGTGYKLYRLTNSGGPGASLTKTTISEPFSKPTRRVNQPGTTATLDPSDGNISHSPYFDGTFIWFTHGGDVNGFPTVRYGRVDAGNNTVVTTWAFHSGSSDDFNPSLAVGITPQGETVYLNWAFTDTPDGTATSAVFASGDASQPIVTIAGAGTIYSPSGGSSNQGRFGDFSSVSVDPSISGCAFATQQYFGADGNWRTRIAPIGQCESIVIDSTR
jgi:hypothetical protein